MINLDQIETEAVLMSKYYEINSYDDKTLKNVSYSYTISNKDLEVKKI